MSESGPPPRPRPWEERLGNRLLSVGAPALPERAQPEPPAALAPFERLVWPRPDGGVLDATWYATPDGRAPRGVVLLAHPWLPYGQAYFHRHGRIEALREAGYAALTFDMSGFGRTTRLARGFRDRDAEAALQLARERAGEAPVHAWGVSAGAYWLMVALARRAWAAGAMFEDVSPHLMEWRVHALGRGRRATSWMRRVVPTVDAYLDLRNHAPHLRVGASAFAFGAKDPGIPGVDARTLARLARGELLVVPEADHLAAIKRDRQRVVDLALRTFAQAEARLRPGERVHEDMTSRPAASP